MSISPEQCVHMMLQYVEELDTAQKKLAEALAREAYAEHDYRVARKHAWRLLDDHAEKLPAKGKEDWVDGLTAEKRFKRDQATAEAKAAMEDVRSRRQQLSAVQSVANSIREEAAFSRVGPDEGALSARIEREERYGRGH